MVKIGKENVKREVKKMCSMAMSVRTSKGGLIALDEVIYLSNFKTKVYQSRLEQIRV